MTAEEKNILDNGGGCSICSSHPAINVDGSYWLCGSCVLERLEDRTAMERELEAIGRQDLIKKVYQRNTAKGKNQRR